MSEKTIEYPCKKCDRKFATSQGRSIHTTRMHPYVPPPPPPRSETKTLAPSLLEQHNLLNGKHLQLGDVFYRVEKHVIKSITKTEGTTTVIVQTEKLRQNWQANEPQ